MSFFFFSSEFNTIVPTILRDKQEYTGVNQHHVDPGLVPSVCKDPEVCVW